jgi:hypothetical protein
MLHPYVGKYLVRHELPTSSREKPSGTLQYVGGTILLSEIVEAIRAAMQQSLIRPEIKYTEISIIKKVQYSISVLLRRV